MSEKIEDYLGVTINSRYGHWQEIKEMKSFLDEANKAGLSQYLNEIFYDSKASLCIFNSDENFLDSKSPIAIELLAIAKKHITQFVWLDDMVYHKTGIFGE